MYLSERSTGMNRGAYYFAGWADGGAGTLKRLGRECRVVGTVDDWADGDEQVLIEASQLYAGMSGGPVVDLARGEVVGVLKSRATDTNGGTAIGVERLRTLPVPVRAATAESDDPYQAVFHAHDRYHADRHSNPVDDEETWADVQRDLGSVAGPALTPQQRVDLLGRLAKLPLRSVPAAFSTSSAAWGTDTGPSASRRPAAGATASAFSTTRARATRRWNGSCATA